MFTAMSDHTRILVLQISVIVYGIATASYGLLSGRTVDLALGVCLLVAVIAVELFGLPLDAARARRTLLAFAATYERRRRPITIAVVVLVGERAIRGIWAAVQRDWLNFAYLTGTALLLATQIWIVSPLLDLGKLENDRVSGRDPAAP
jgi:hypothetical protein